MACQLQQYLQQVNCGGHELWPSFVVHLLLHFLDRLRLRTTCLRVERKIQLLEQCSLCISKDGQLANSLNKLPNSITARNSQLLFGGCFCATVACDICNTAAVHQQAPNNMLQDHMSTLAASLIDTS